MFKKYILTFLILLISINLSNTHSTKHETTNEKHHEEHVFLIKTNLTKQEVQERLSKEKMIKKN